MSLELQSSREITDLFFRAVGAGESTVVAELVHAHPELVKKTTQQWPGDGQTALMMAAKKGHEACLDVLLAAGSDAKVKDESGPTDHTALTLAARHGHDGCVKILLPHSETKGASSPIVTALMFAAESGNANSIRLLLPWSDAKARARDGSSALMFASAGGHAEAVRRLLPYSDPKAWGVSGHTALIFAAIRGSVECVRLLLPVSDVMHQDNTGHSARLWAQEKGHWNCVDVLSDALSAQERALLLSQSPAGALPRQLAMHERSHMQTALSQQPKGARETAPVAGVAAVAAVTAQSKDSRSGPPVRTRRM